MSEKLTEEKIEEMIAELLQEEQEKVDFSKAHYNMQLKLG